MRLTTGFYGMYIHMYMYTCSYMYMYSNDYVRNSNTTYALYIKED